MKKLRILIMILFAATLGGIIYYFAQFPETIAPALYPLLMIAAALLLGFSLKKKYGLSWRLYGIGALTFAGSQVLHIPFNYFFLNPWKTDTLGLKFEPGTAGLLVTGALLGLSAGLFEETARYIVFRRWLREERSWKEALMFGAGHGGGEAIILGILTFYGFLQMLILYQATPDVFQFLVGADQLEITRIQVEQFWDYPWHFFLLPTLERISAMGIHLGLTVLVLQAFRRNNISWYFLAVGWHTLVNTVAVYGGLTWNVYALEGVILLLGLISLVIVRMLRSPDDPEEPPEIRDEFAPALPALPAESTDITIEQLKDSRYD